MKNDMLSKALKNLRRDKMQVNIKGCYKVISTDNLILNQNVSYALRKYLNFIVTNRDMIKFTPEHFESIFKDLLEQCCEKPYKEISRMDVNKNEQEILYQIKKSIITGATNYIYKKEPEIKLEPIKKNNIKLELADVEKYFGDLEIYEC